MSEVLSSLTNLFIFKYQNTEFPNIIIEMQLFTFTFKFKKQVSNNNTLSCPRTEGMMTQLPPSVSERLF